MMQSTSTQVKITFPDELYFFLRSKAGKYGLPVSSYIKNLVINDVRNMDLPTFKMNNKTEEVALAALENQKKGKTNEIREVDEFLNNL